MYIWIAKEDVDNFKKGDIVNSNEESEWKHWLVNHCVRFEIMNIPLDEIEVIVDEKNHIEIKRNMNANIEKEVQEKIFILYKQMVKKITNRMYEIFGTRNSDSALAYERTWSDMKDNPSFYTSFNLMTDIELSNLSVGEIMASEESVLEYATKKLELLHDYAAFRMKTIQDFKINKQKIISEYGL